MSKTNDVKEPALVNKTADDDPVGSCTFVNHSGQLVCIDNMKKSECDQFQGSTFVEDGACD